MGPIVCFFSWKSGKLCKISWTKTIVRFWWVWIPRTIISGSTLQCIPIVNKMYSFYSEKILYPFNSERYDLYHFTVTIISGSLTIISGSVLQCIPIVDKMYSFYSEKISYSFNSERYDLYLFTVTIAKQRLLNNSWT